jgi:hypothetical protein
MERFDRDQLVQLRVAMAKGDMSTLDWFEEDCFDDTRTVVRESTVILAAAVTEARVAHSGIWAEETFETRGNMVGVWLARMKTVGGKALRVRRAYQAWLDRIEAEADARRSEMLSRLAFWIMVADLPTGNEGIRIARRALALATTPLDEARALTEIGYALMGGENREAEAALVAAMSRVQDGPARWKAQYHHAYLAHAEREQTVANERYLALFNLMAATPGALETDLGWTVATDLLGFLRAAEDSRIVEVQCIYDAACTARDRQ